MIAAINIRKTGRPFTFLPYLLIALYILIFVSTLRTYIIWQSVNLILGLISIPFISSLNTNKRSNRFAYAAAITVLLGMFMPVKTMLFASLIFSVLFIIENFWGAINLLPVIACLLISPFFQYAIALFGFTIRLMLSSVAASVLNLFGEHVTVAGNIIQLNGKEFAVDPACMGLNMMVTSILFGVFVIGIYQKKYQKTVGYRCLFTLLVIIAAFNIGANLLRIIVLVKFSIMPENKLHEVAGLICLLVYVFIPATVLVKRSILKFGKNEAVKKDSHEPGKHALSRHIMIIALVTLLSCRVDKREYTIVPLPAGISCLKGCKVESTGDNIIKIESATSLIYIKPISSFYDSEHNPSICWKGSGYELKRIKSENIKNIQVNSATLEKSGSVLFTAWWFDNGEKQTVSQLEWRWQMFKGLKPFSIINITAASKEELEKQVALFLTNHISKQILSSKKLKS